MSFVSIEFIVLFLSCFLLFHLVGTKGRKCVLLLGSCVFIGYHHWAFLLTALLVAVFSYGAGHAIERSRAAGRSRVVYALSVVLLVAIWIGFRYADKLVGNGSILFPLGISFYTFQAIAYLTDIYWEEEAEGSLLDFVLYMLFFMKFLSGPIERSESLLPQLRELKPATYEMMTYGLKLALIGLLKKLIIADQLSPYVSGIFDSSHTASGIQLLMACLLYPIELYADFSGYTDMALGGAMLFGIRLSPNFSRPFAAQSTSDFWRRWHMSLSFWVRDYVYMPLTSALRGWGRWGVYVSLILTFIALGVWHGAGWTFVVYGLIQGIVIVYEVQTASIRQALQTRIGRLLTGWGIVRTYLVFAFSLIFFRASSLADAWYFITHLSFHYQASWKEMNIGMSDHICIVVGVGWLLVCIYEYFMARVDLLEKLARQHAVLRWSIYYLIVFAILAYGKLGTEDFIYLQF